MIAKPLRANLKAIVRSYAKATGKTEAAVSREFYGSTRFLSDFYAGEKTISLDKFDSMLTAIYAKWPEGAERPVLRPVILPSPSPPR